MNYAFHLVNWIDELCDDSMLVGLFIAATTAADVVSVLFLFASASFSPP